MVKCYVKMKREDSFVWKSKKLIKEKDLAKVNHSRGGKALKEETEDFQKYSTVRHFRTKSQGDPYEKLLPCAYQHIFP